MPQDTLLMTAHSRFSLQFFDTSHERFIALIEHPGKPGQLAAFSPNELVSTYAFNQRLAEFSHGTRWQGSSKQLDQMIQRQIGHVQTISGIHN